MDFDDVWAINKLIFNKDRDAWAVDILEVQYVGADRYHYYP